MIISHLRGIARTPGVMGAADNRPLIDPGTLCRQLSGSPGAVGQKLSTSFPHPILVGKAKREPRFNFDGTPAEDWLYGDRPIKSAAIMTDPVFALSDDLLGAYLRQLMTSLSIGRMETVAVAMQEQFCSGKGGVFHDAALDAEIAGNAAFIAYRREFENELAAALQRARFDPTHLTVLSMKLLNFSSFWDKVSGLAITVHQVWSAKAELENYHVDCATGRWHGELKYTFYDHYGLDWEDILKHGSDRIPQYHTGDFFKAWYILQHYRSARPLLTEMRETVPITGRVN